MPRYDDCHDQVVRALQKEGWSVDKVPFRVSEPYRTIFIDVKMSRGSNGQQRNILLVEIKCFPDQESTTHELYAAFGQYIVYRAMLLETDQVSNLYLTIPDMIFERFFDVAVMRAVSDNRIRIVVVNVEREEVMQWID